MSRQPILLLEAAVHLLRRVPAGIWAWHTAGSVPLALGALFFWNTIINPRTSNVTAAAASLGMSILLVWMNCCRAIFARELERLLKGAPDTPWTPARLGRLLANQAPLAASKLIVLPIAALIVFPFAHTVAFYRYASVLDRPDAIARARKLAGIESGQGWTLLLLLQFLGILTAINVALGLAILPHMVRILTGYDSAFTRSGVYYILNPLFVMLVVVVTWIVFDPLVQAAYTLRCFYVESLETGEDLRVSLRRIRAALTAAACVLLMIAAIPSADAAIPRERLEESIQQAVQAPEYDWRLPPKPVATGKSWLVEIADRTIAQVSSIWERISSSMDRAIRWLIKQLGGKLPEPRLGAPPARLHGSIYLLIAVTLAAATIFGWRAFRARTREQQAVAGPIAAAVPLDAEDLSPERLPEEQWIALAEQCQREGNFRSALRALYLANLAWLGRREFLTLHSGKTNREYEAEMRRRGRAMPEANGLFGANIAVFERAWYGDRVVSHGEVDEFRSRIDQMKRLAMV